MAKRLKQHEIDALMENIPLLPKSFGDWMMKTPFQDMNYMFYKRIKNKMHGYCSKCGKLTIHEKKKSHNESGRCPNCRTKVTYKAINKAKTFQDNKIVSIIQKMGEGYIVRYFKVRRIFKSVNDSTKKFPEEILETLSKPSNGYYEGSRVYISFGKRGDTQYRNFEEAWSYSDGDYRWVNERKRGGINNKELLRASDPFIYKRNLKSILKISKWKYCGLDYYKGKHINIDDYIFTYEKYPSIEMLSKLGFKALLNQIIYRTNYYNGIGGLLNMHKKYLGLSGDVFNRAKRLNLKTEGIEFISTLEECGRYLSDRQVIWAIENTHTETFTQLLKWISPQKIINYIEKNSSDKYNRGFTYKGSNRTYFATIWRDYLQQCESLDLDIINDFVLFPRDLEKKHIEFTELIKVNADKRLDKGIKVQYEKWNNLLSYQSGSLKIVVADSHEAILKEGQSQRHCVGGSRYSERMLKGKKLILFIRKNEIPYYTVEFDVQEMKVIQNRGYQNKGVNREVEKFMNKWRTKKLLPLMQVDTKAM